MIRISRRDFAVLGVAAVLERSALAQTDAGPIITRAIPSTGERVAAVGLGTARVFAHVFASERGGPVTTAWFRKMMAASPEFRSPLLSALSPRP